MEYFYFARKQIERDKDGKVLTKEIWYKKIKPEERQSFIEDNFVIETKESALETLDCLNMRFDRNRSSMTGWIVY